ncbi:hypothetical protein [Ruegeria marina]|uniref:O-antigen ligase like membrane protein n=1 Tax=Ruegeria marina TaxID=639004 RepID=A0A1G6T6C8_9RHOB|nr:hypothetical protein [Ruegeria marina]SDD24503.1 hypothetical protein SAMN04488239_10616 [Ruegeria marina]
MPNPVAYLMLMLWPLVCVALFVRLPVRHAIIWGILGGYLILPPVAELDLPLIPSLNKDSIASVATFLACLVIARQAVPLLPRARPVRVLVAAFILCAVPTVLTNREPLIFEVLAGSEPIRFITNQIPGLGLRDLLSIMIGQVIVLLPFFLGRAHLSDENGLRAIILGLAVAGLAYSLPSLFEINFAPVINIFVYGFFQHDFSQMIRDGGFRPIVFLPHGLWLAFFMVTALISAAALARASQDNERLKWGMATLYLALVLNACKSLAALMYGMALVPVVLFLRRKMVIRLALAIALLAITYPALRNLGLIPLDAILEKAAGISAERAQSLEFRFTNEELLLDRAHDKPWFGWGGWGRNLELDPETGMIISIPDGAWIIVFGTFGWLGYIAQMGLLAAPIIMAALHIRKTPPESVSDALAPIAVILAATMTDMLLNATLTPFTWLCAGAVVGYIERQWYPDWSHKRRGMFGSGPALGGTVSPGDKRTIL